MAFLSFKQFGGGTFAVNTAMVRYIFPSEESPEFTVLAFSDSKRMIVRGAYPDVVNQFNTAVNNGALK